MKFKIDENLPVEVADEIRTLGHEAETVFAESLAGFPDEKIVAAAREEKRVLITMDKGIADVRRYPPGELAGIVLLRPKRAGRLAVIEFVRRHFSSVATTELAGRLVVVSDAGIRMR